MDENGPYKTAVLWRGTRGEASRNSPEQSLSPRLRGTGGTGHPRRTDGLCRRHCRTGPGSAFGSGLRARLGLWVDPIHQGKTRTVLDAILRDVAARHPWVSAHPDVISRWASRKSCTEIIDPAVRRAADPRLLLDHRDQRLLRALAGFQKVGNSCPAATGGAAEAQCQWDGCCRDAVTRRLWPAYVDPGHLRMALLPTRFTLKMMNDRADTLDAWFETNADFRGLTAAPATPHRCST